MYMFLFWHGGAYVAARHHLLSAWHAARAASGDLLSLPPTHPPPPPLLSGTYKTHFVVTWLFCLTPTYTRLLFAHSHLYGENFQLEPTLARHQHVSFILFLWRLFGIISCSASYVAFSNLVCISAKTKTLRFCTFHALAFYVFTRRFRRTQASWRAYGRRRANSLMYAGSTIR